jgi:hypothetical protein
MVAPYYGWYVVAACVTIAGFSWGFAFYGLGVYLHVLVRLHGWATGPTGERREPGGPRVRPRPDRADSGYAREVSAGPLGPGRLGSSRPRAKAA